MILRKGIKGQAYPSGTVNTVLYTVPANMECVINGFTVCNQLSAMASYSMATVPSGTSLEPKNYRYFETPIPPKETFLMTTGMTLGSNDTIVVWSSATGLSFNLDGQENTIV